jgi:uncharacterized protein (TIGR02246 family)
MKEILSLEEQALERWRNGDPSGFVELGAEDITYIDPALTKPILGLREFEAYMRAAEGKVHYQRSEFIDPRIVVAGDAAVLSYNYRSSVVSPEGKLVSQTPWNATEVYVRRDGRWRIVHAHWSYVQHKLAEKVEVPVPVELRRTEYTGVMGEVMALEAAAMERWRKGDPWGFVELCAPEVTYFDTGTPQRLNGIEALRAEYATREGKIHYDVMEFIAPMVQVCGELAALSYRFFSTQLDPDGSIASRTPWNCSEVYRRIDGKWRIVHNHWSHIRGKRA